MAKGKTIYRVACRHKPYAQLGNAMIRDNRLTFEARGVLAYILSFPSNWQFGQEWLCKKTGLGRDRAYRIVKELCTRGYCLRQQQRRPDGTLGPYEYVFTDEPGAIETAPGGDPQDVVGGGSDGGAGPQEDASPLPEKPEAAEPEAAEPEAAEPDTANQEAAYKDLKTISPKDRKETKTESGVSFSILGTDGACGAVTAPRRQTAQAERAVCSAEVVLGGRLPFTPEVLREVGALGLDIETLIERYRRKTVGRTIAEPNAYLLQMACDEAAKACGATPQTATKIGKAARAERARRASAETVERAQSEPTDRALAALARSARHRGHDPAALIAGWRQSAGGRRFATRAAADASLAAFAAARFLGPAAPMREVHR